MTQHTNPLPASSQRALEEPTMDCPVPSDPSITSAHLVELAVATGRPSQQANVLRGARLLELRFACTPITCSLCRLRHAYHSDRFEAPTAGARFSIESIVEGHRLLVCTAHAGLRTARAGALAAALGER